MMLLYLHLCRDTLLTFELLKQGSYEMWQFKASKIKKQEDDKG